MATAAAARARSPSATTTASSSRPRLAGCSASSNADHSLLRNQEDGEGEDVRDPHARHRLGTQGAACACKSRSAVPAGRARTTGPPGRRRRARRTPESVTDSARQWPASPAPAAEDPPRHRRMRLSGDGKESRHEPGRDSRRIARITAVTPLRLGKAHDAGLAAASPAEPTRSRQPESEPSVMRPASCKCDSENSTRSGQGSSFFVELSGVRASRIRVRRTPVLVHRSDIIDWGSRLRVGASEPGLPVHHGIAGPGLAPDHWHPGTVALQAPGRAARPSAEASASCSTRTQGSILRAHLEFFLGFF